MTDTVKPKRKYTRRPKVEVAPVNPREGLDAMRMVTARAKAKTAQDTNIFRPNSNIHPFKPANGLALDSQFDTNSNWALQAYTQVSNEGQAFLGYPALSEMATRPEYRRASETVARHMTRKWIKFSASGDEKDDKIAAIEKEMIRLNVKEHFQKCAELDGFFGRAHLFLDFGDIDDAEELQTPIGDGQNILSQVKCSPDQPLTRLKVVEPVWCYPLNYNANDPLSDDWYTPSIWSVLGKSLHATRLLTFIGREVPDMLKPSYSFGGLSLSQMGKPSVDNWLQTRSSVNAIISAFSVMVLKINLKEVLQGAGEKLFERIELFNAQRDNRGLLTIDTSEEFENVSAPLSGLSDLQSQAQEHMASVWGIPVEILNGIQPMGLNASSEGQIRVFYDWIASCQEKLFRPNLTTVINFIQLSLWGQVDPDITFEFNDLEGMSDDEKAAMELVKAQTHEIYTNMGAVDVSEVRHAIAADVNSPYNGLDPDKAPEMPGEKELWAEVAKGLTNEEVPETSA
jgi:phage-related protein (TIGR01555 family)